MKKKTYDIINAGPRNRFMANGKIVSNSGQGIQIQNLAKADIKNVEGAISDIMSGMGAKKLEEKYNAPALTVISSCLRGTIIPEKDHLFCILDLNAIEARTACYLAGQDDVLEVFTRGEDVYQYASDKLGLGSRASGKVATLGLTYGMGAERFVDYAGARGVEFDLERAQEVVSSWRKGNSRIVSLWAALDAGLHQAIEISQKAPDRKHSVQINKYIDFEVAPAADGKPLLTIGLPSGRRLFYRNIRYELHPTKQNHQIAFDGVNKKWGTVFTYAQKIFENINQGFARDILCSMMSDIARLGAGRIVATVHDEVIVEIPQSDSARAFEIIAACMNAAPTWAPTIPVKSAGGVKARYEK